MTMDAVFSFFFIGINTHIINTTLFLFLFLFATASATATATATANAQVADQAAAICHCHTSPVGCCCPNDTGIGV
jgi:hypothetical protein